MAKSVEAQGLLRELDGELSSASKRSGQTLEWSAAEQLF